jgi:TPR repeat protein
MRVGVTVASAFLLGTPPVTLAQSLNDNQLSAIAQSGIAHCSVDPRTADIRSQCRSSSASASHDQPPAQTKYAVDGLAIGSRVKIDSTAYREYKCRPSELFDGFTWCQKARNYNESRAAYAVTYSFVHARDGRVVYVNRYQEPTVLSPNEADEDIQRYSSKIGESPRIIKIPPQPGLADGILALWGRIILERLDQNSINVLAAGGRPKKGLLIDFIGNFARSARENLPIYRISGNAGFVWRASFDQKASGSLRFAAVDASELSPPSQALVAAQLSSGSAEDSPVTECDSYAASPLDPHRKTAGIPEEELNPSFAIPACVSAVRTFPSSPRLNYQLGRAYWKSNNFGGAIVWAQQAAQYQYAPAQAILGYMFQFGQGVPQSNQEALVWYTKAANRGFAPAQKNLGLFYEMGLGVTKDLVQASEWYRKAAEQGNIIAQNNLEKLAASITKEAAEENTATEAARKKAEEQSAAEGL